VNREPSTKPRPLAHVGTNVLLRELSARSVTCVVMATVWANHRLVAYTTGSIPEALGLIDLCARDLRRRILRSQHHG